jgi:hypothetical protein
MKTATMNFFQKKETPKELANRAKRETKKEVRVSEFICFSFIQNIGICLISFF